MKLNTTVRISVLIFLLFGRTAIAQNTRNIPDSLSKELTEVVVTANRYGSLKINTPEAIRIVDGTKVQRQQLRTAPEALAITPGVFIQKTNHGGGSPFIRGLTGNQTLLLIDGIRLSNSVVRYGPNQYFNTIDVFGTGKFEVMRGSGSVQYGSDAIGGTIQAFSHNLRFSESPGWRGTFLTRFATHGMEQTGHGNVGFSNKLAAFRAGVTARNFGDLVGGDTTGRQTPTGYKELDFDIKGKIALSPSTSLTMLLQRVHQSDVPVYHKVVLENYQVNRMHQQERMLGYARVNHDFGDGVLRSAVVTASIQKSNELRESRRNGSFLLRSENDRVRTFSVSADAVLKKGSFWSSNTGIEMYNDNVSSNRTDIDLNEQSEVLKRGLYPDGSEMTSLAAYSLHDLDFQNWYISGGLRINSYINIISDPILGDVILKPRAIVGSIAVLRKLGPVSRLFISAGNGFRAPNIDDLGTLGIVDFRYETPNFSLKPEHSFQYQAGYKFQGKKLKGEIYLFRNELYNLIVRNRVPGDTIDGYPVYIKENVERAYIQGVETAWEYELTSSVSISGNLTRTIGQNLSKNEPVRRIPPMFGRLAAEYQKDAWNIGAEWLAAAKQDRLAQGDKDDNRIPEGGTPGWNVINMYAGYTFKKVSIDLSLVNLANQDYRYHGSGINGMGRSAFLTVALNL